MRARLISQVRDRVARFDADGPDVVLADEAIDEVVDLLCAVPDPLRDHEVAQAAAYLFVYRAYALGTAGGEADLRVALELFAPVYRRNAAYVPEVVHEFFVESPPRDVSSATMLAGLGRSQFAQAWKTGEDAPLDRSITLLRRAAAAAGPGDPEHARSMSGLGNALMTRFDRTGRADDLAGAVEFTQAAVDATPAEDPALASYLSALGSALLTRAEHLSSEADLDAAIRAGEAAVAGWPDHPEHAKMIHNLGLALRARDSVRDQLAELDRTIEARRGSKAPDRVHELDSLLMTRFERDGDPADLDDAIRAHRDALSTAGAEGSRADHQSRLSDLLLTRFVHFGRVQDLEDAVGAGRDAVAATPGDDPEFGGHQLTLANALSRRYQVTGVFDDLAEAITLGRSAVTATELTGRDAPLTSLSISLRMMFERTGDVALLEEAVDVARAALDTGRWVVIGDDTRPSPRLFVLTGNAGAALLTYARHTGSRTDLDEAVGLLREAALAAPEASPDRATVLANLAAALRWRFDLTGEPDDLDEAVNAGRRSVLTTAPGSPAWRTRVVNLVAVLLARHEANGDPEDLDEAYVFSRDAVNGTLSGRSNRVGLLVNHAQVLRERFRRTGRADDIAAAVGPALEAVTEIPLDHPDRSGYLVAAVQTLVERYVAATAHDLGFDDEDFDDEDFENADLHNPGPDDPDADDLGFDDPDFDHPGFDDDFDEAALHDPGPDADEPVLDEPGSDDSKFDSSRSRDPARYDVRLDDEGLDRVLALLREATAIGAAPPRVRAQAAALQGSLAAAADRWPEAAAGYAAAIDLLGRTIPRSLSRRDQEILLRVGGGTAADAVACCVRAGMPVRAVELFEQGRGLLMSRALDARTDLTALAERHPESAARFADLSAVLDPPVGPMGDEPTGGATTPARRAAAEEFDRLVADIRARPGFDRFLLPPAVDDLAPAEGHAVIVSVSRLGTYALALSAASEITVVPLPRLTPDAVWAEAGDFLDATRDVRAASARTRAAGQDRIVRTLGWLWDTIAGPVLDRLGLTGVPRPGDPWPRLWWCASGVLSLPPLPAAGHHGTAASAVPSTVLDRAVSSVTPTLRALAWSRRRPEPPDDTDRAVVVAMPRTPGFDADLPAASIEATLVERAFRGEIEVLTGTAATHDAVLAALRGSRWAHFACHSHSDLTDPSTSRLLLADHHRHPFTVVDLARLPMDHADLAFLSACATARPGARLTDEVIHLASACQVAGYRHVIGTLWPVGDQPALEFAEFVYPAIAAGADIATAVHGATRRLRDRWPDDPADWASHIHVGG